MTLDEQVARGDRAARLLADPLLVEAFDVLERELHQAWLNSPAGHEREREQIWLMVQLHRRVKGHLEEATKTGRIAQLQIENEEQRRR